MIIEKLTQLGFTENVDYTFEEGVLSAIEKTRIVEQEIEHPAVEAVFEEQEVLDEEGNFFDPPQFEQVEITPAQEAYTEIVEVEESYFDNIPNLNSLKELIIADFDVSLMTDIYLKDKKEFILKDDSFNISNGVIVSWNFQNIDRPSIDFLFNSIDAVKPKTEEQLLAEKAKQDKIEAGKKAREICQKALDYIAGENLDRELTLEQITTMQSLFADTESALRAGRPSLALYFINQIEPDGTLVTETLKQEVLSILNE